MSRVGVRSPRRVLLIGMMGAGKSTSGRLLAAHLGWPYIDTDDEIERRVGKTIPEIWKQDGEAAFREQESLLLGEVCGSEGPTIVSVAGGAVIAPANRAVVKRAGLVVWLRAEVSTLVARVGVGDGRPLLSGGAAEALSRLWAQRAPIYAELAEMTLDVDRLSPSQVVESIVEALDSDRDVEGSGYA
jgi:shikimate kinase